jgi:hypothetical protein
MSMTMTYARITDRTVATGYFAVTNRSRPLNTQAETNRVDTVEGPNMRGCARTTRLLRNGHCTRRAVLDCRYE